MNTFELELLKGIIFAGICGGFIGIERQVRGKPVGIRTSIFICLGTMLFVQLGIVVNNGIDPVRILGQIVTGIGFLGAGVIMNKEGIVSGVTSAAIVWLLAGIGSAIGFKFYKTAVLFTCSMVIIQVTVHYMETRFRLLQRGVHRLHRRDKED